MSTSESKQTNNKKTLMGLSILALAMLSLGFASKPLYDTFCRITGYGGTTRVAEVASQTMLDRQITVRFDANINPELDWTFKPQNIAMSVKLGENALAYYEAKNNTDTALVGTASYNVSPIKAAPYFSKLECFCFTEQRLEPGEAVKMPVLFFVDPLMAEDPRLDEIKTITLSYTFHKVETPGEDALSTKDRDAKLKDIQALNLNQITH